MPVYLPPNTNKNYLDWIIKGPGGAGSGNLGMSDYTGPGVDTGFTPPPDFGNLESFADSGVTGSQVSENGMQSNPNDAISKYIELLSQAPKREGYKLNLSQAISAGLLGSLTSGNGRGLETTQNELDRPYNQAQHEYKQRLEGAGHLVGLENAVSSRDMAQKNYARQLENDKAQERNRVADNDRASLEFQERVVNNVKQSDERLDEAKGRREDRDEDRKARKQMHDETLSFQRDSLEERKNGRHGPAPKYVSTKEQKTARQDAIEDMLSEDPELEKYFEGEPGKRNIKSVTSEVENKSSWMSPSTWGSNESHPKMTKEELKALEDHISKRMKKILGMTRESDDE